MTTTTECRIYVACLAAYNNGKLHGAWIDADQDAEDIYAEIQEMLRGSPEPDAEDWAIHDSEGLSCSEHMSIETVAEMVRLIGEHGEVARAALDYCGGSAPDAQKLVNNGYGIYDDVAAYAQDYHESCGSEVPAYLEHAIDWEKVGEDLLADCVVLDLDDGNIAVCTW